jgi:O-antigen/teichoic acid export membrane protein
VNRVVGTLRSPVTPVASAALWARLMILLVIAVGSRSLSHDSFYLLVYTLAVSTAAQTLLDPGVSSLVPVRWPTLDVDARAQIFRSGLVLQSIAGLLMAITTAAIVVAAHRGREAFEIGVSVGCLVAVEGIARYARVRYQVNGDFRRFAAVDIVIGVGRAATAVVLLLSATVASFALANLVWALIFAILVYIYTRRSAGSLELARLAREVWPYGASTSFAALYSQAPAVLLGILGDLKAAAVYAVAARITQPTELVPSAISSVFLPRLAREWASERRATFLRQAKLACAVGVAFALVIALGAGPILGIFSVEGRTARLVLFVLAAVLPIKFLNYQLVALALAERRVRQRLIASIVVGVASVAIVCVLAKHGPVMVAGATLASECLLCTLLLRVSRTALLVPRTAI